MTDKFKMVRYDINGEIKDGSLSIWEKIKYGFIATLVLPIMLEDLRGE